MSGSVAGLGMDARSEHAKRYDAILERARGLAPALRDRAAEAEALRRIPDATVQDMHDTGLFRVLQPLSLGGSELDYVVLVDLGAALARGCASSAWVFTNLAVHHWMLAMFPKQAQDRLWDEDPDVLIASSLIFPCGKAKAVKGGYTLSGRWPFSSGVDPCGWEMLGGIVAGEDGDAPDYRVFLLPNSDYEIIDTWHVSGLCGTGSNDVAVNEVFIPEAMTLAVDDIKGGPTPGSEVHPNPVYQIPLFPLFPYVLSGVGLGNAEGAFDDFVTATKAKSARYSGAKIADFQSVQMNIAEAAAKIDAARLIMRQACIESMDDACAGHMPDMEKRTRYRRDGAFSTNLCTQAVTLLNGASGGGGLYTKGHMQRAFRDAHAIDSHIAFRFDVAGTGYGRVVLGLDPDNPTL